MRPDSAALLRGLLALALEEDLGDGDITGEATIPPDAMGRAEIRAKQELVVAGTTTLEPLWMMVDHTVTLAVFVNDGVRVSPGTVVAELRGNIRSLLAGERTCLNLLGRLCGVATLTAAYVAAAAGTRAEIFDTRKTSPGLRFLEKAAVRAGGGRNHRLGLFDEILIKDNHVDAAGGIGPAIDRARSHFPNATVEVEVRNSVELAAAVAHGAEIILLDNMDLDQIQAAVTWVAGRAQLEVSGGVTLDRIPRLAATGIDRISCGALTHSAPVADLHMKLVATT